MRDHRALALVCIGGELGLAGTTQTGLPCWRGREMGENRIMGKDDREISVCVLCGEPWLPSVKNRCECGGFCTWGAAKGAPPDSWDVTEEGWTPKPVPEDVAG